MFSGRFAVVPRHSESAIFRFAKERLFVRPLFDERKATIPNATLIDPNAEVRLTSLQGYGVAASTSKHCDRILISKGKATMPWSIRRATVDDAPTIVDFNCRLAKETEDLDLDAALIQPGVQAGLGDQAKALYFVAENDAQEIVGQIMVTFEWSDWRNGWFYWIQSVYVRHDSRRQGVFRALFEHVEQRATNDSDVIGLRLYVDDTNAPAQETYYNLGMKRSTYFVLEKYPL